MKIFKIEHSSSLLNKKWQLLEYDERKVIYLSQKTIYHQLFLNFYLKKIKRRTLIFTNQILQSSLPDPLQLKIWMLATKELLKLSKKKHQKIGIIADYDVDGSTSASILYKFLKNIIVLFLKTPNRLVDGYGPNIKLMDQMHEKY